MIEFVSTFPPLMCGIGTYTKYLVSHMPLDAYRIISFKLDDFFWFPESYEFNGQTVYELSLKDPTLPASLKGRVIWFQHAFGIWGEDPSHFSGLLEDAKKRGKKVVASFHTIHFQSPETDLGMQEKETDLLEKTLPLLDACTVFTRGAHQALTRAFPRYRKKVVVIRHGVYLHSLVSQREAREKVIRYLIDQADISSQKRRDLKKYYSFFFSPKTVLLGNIGFITVEKAFSDLYQLRRLVQEKLPHHRVIALVFGRIQRRKDKTIEKTKKSLLERLKSMHNGQENLFFENHVPEVFLPLVFRALDFSVFWCHNATQSGRMAHAQGTGTCVVGRKIEGIGETLELSGLPASETLEELAETIQRFTLHPELRKEAQRLSREYARKYSYAVQAKKHLHLAESLVAGRRLPLLDRVS